MKKSIVAVLFFVLPQLLFAQMQPVKLQCEYLDNPLGVDIQHPRLSWQLQDERQGAKQTAYQLIVTSDTIDLKRAFMYTVWNSGKVKADSQRVTYKGALLKPFTKYYWKVTVWDAAGKPSTASASFETGLMGDWKGSWISDSRDIKQKAAPYFRKEFTSGKTIKKATAYVAAGGLYELYINGEKTGNHRLDPMYTRFDRRTLYVTYDVTSQVQQGKNAIGLLLGNGWYNHQSTAVWFFHEAPWRNRPTFCMDLRIQYNDGTVETIASGRDWKTALSPIVFNSIYTAEHYDANKELPGWNTVGFDDKKWRNAIPRQAPSNHIVSQQLHPIRNVEKIPATTLTRLNDTTWLYDLGRNIAGVSEVVLSGDSGQVVRLKHAERLKANGWVDMSNIDVHYRPTDDTDPFQVDMVTLNGKGSTRFTPHFNYKGFQFVELTSNKPISLKKEDLNGWFMHSDVPVTGHIASSNPMVDKLWSATNNSYLSNLFGYPTDCPQREKNGWTGDAHIASETGLYSFDAITVYEKWLADHRDEQQPDGVLPSIIPSDGWGYDWGNGPDWTSTIAIIPWNLYLFYGDTQPLKDNFENMKRYVDHISSIAPDGLTTWGLGDWVPVKSTTPVEFTSSVYYYTDASIVAKAAALLGNTIDANKYNALAKKIKDAINAKYLNTATAIYNKGVQTEMSVPLMWDIVPAELRDKVAANLAKRVVADGNGIDVGLLGTKAILNALSENGYADMAYQLATKDSFPGWGWWIKNGATTLFENWPMDAGSDISRNHIMFGEIGAWLYKALGGIKPDPTKPGFKNVLLEPHFVQGLQHFEASHEGPFGKIISSWKRENGKVQYHVVVPPNSTATVIVKKGKVLLQGKAADASKGLAVNAGSYDFEVEE